MALLRQRHGNTVIRPDEMQAYVFQVWNAQKQRGKRLPVGNIVQRAFNKIGNVLTKTKRFLQGKGYNTWESVFEAAAEGEVGRRGVPKTEAEAKAIGERRAREIAEAKETVPISEIEGKRSVTPLGEIKASVSPTTVYPKSNVRGTINSNNPIFRPLGFRPSQEAMSILNNAADMIVETKKRKVPQTETERVNRSADMQPAYNEINNFKNKLISEKPEQENVVREMLKNFKDSRTLAEFFNKVINKKEDVDDLDNTTLSDEVSSDLPFAKSYIEELRNKMPTNLSDYEGLTNLDFIGRTNLNDLEGLSNLDFNPRINYRDLAMQQNLMGGGIVDLENARQMMFIGGIAKAAKKAVKKAGLEDDEKFQDSGGLFPTSAAITKKHKAKLVIARLDRLARNLYFIASLM